MKTVLLIRHAKSSWDDHSISDFDRPLNNRGKKDAPAMAELTFKKKIIPDVIISSPANRAFTTAKHFAEVFKYPVDKIVIDETIYSDGYRAIITIIKNLDASVNTVFIFGHNPDLTFLINKLSDSTVDNLPTTGVSCIDFKVDNWNEIGEIRGKLRFLEYPKLIAK